MNHFESMYYQKRLSREELASMFQSYWTCVSDIALVLPYEMYHEVEKRITAGEISNLTFHTLLDTEHLLCYDTDFSAPAKGISWFTGNYARAGIRSGRGDVMPNYYRDMPSLFSSLDHIDAYCAVVSPMDENGYFSTFNGSNGYAMKSNARHIFLEVNQYMPYIPSSPQIHISEATALFENHKPLATLQTREPDPVSTAIGNLIASEIPDTATIQLGIGAIPEAVGRALSDKRDLGIHTEMFTDSMVELIQSGVVTNEKKPIHTGHSVATFAFGSQKMYDFLDNNPTIDMLPVNYTNDPKVIAEHPKMISVNAAIEVDFWGQVCAESMGPAHFSGTGGQADFVRGAVESDGGKSFIAFPSTAKNGTVSRICPTLAMGSVVTTSKNDVDYIVTEYGIAKLRGKTLKERTRELITIAHPAFREKLLFEAKKNNIFYN